MPARPSGLPGRDDQALLAVDEADDRDVALAEDAVDVGQRVLAGLGVEQVRAGEVAEAVAQRDEPAERADVRGGERHAGIARRAARRRRGRGRGRASRSATIVRSISPTPRSSATSTCSPAWWPSRPAGTTSRPSARTSEVSTPAPRGSGVGDQLAADASEPDAHPVVHAHRRGELAREPRAGPRPLGRRGALEGGEQRRGEDVEGQRRPRPGSRARRAPACASTAPRTTGWPGRTATPWTASVPEPLDDARPCGRRGRRSSRRRRSRGRRARRRRARRRRSRSGRRGRSRSATRLAARRLGLRGEHQRVRVEDHARAPARCRPGGSRRRWGAPRRRARGGRRTSMAPAAAAAATSTARRRWPVGQQQLGGADVLADRAHVLVGRDRRAQLGARRVVVVDVLAHDHGVEARRASGRRCRRTTNASGSRSTGVLSLAPTVSRGAHGDAVHRRRRRTTATSASPTPARR